MLLPLKYRSSADLLRFLRKGMGLTRTYYCFYRIIEENQPQRIQSIFLGGGGGGEATSVADIDFVGVVGASFIGVGAGFVAASVGAFAAKALASAFLLLLMSFCYY